MARRGRGGGGGGGTFVLILQIFASLASLAIVLAGVFQLRDSHDLVAEWCPRVSGQDYHPCWTKHYNAVALFTFQALGVILLGAFSFLAELQVNELSRPAGLLLVVGLLTLGVAKNTGILVGSFSMVMGFSQLVVFFAMGSAVGPLRLGGGSLSQPTVVFVQLLVALASVGVMTVGVMTIVAVADEDAGPGLEWFDPDDDNSWLTGGRPTFTVGVHGVTLMLLGVCQLLANLNLTDVLKPLRPWHILGALGLINGTLALPAVGNTGILLGSLCIVAGFLQFTAAMLYDVRNGYLKI